MPPLERAHADPVASALGVLQPPSPELRAGAAGAQGMRRRTAVAESVGRPHLAQGLDPTGPAAHVPRERFSKTRNKRKIQLSKLPKPKSMVWANMIGKHMVNEIYHVVIKFH
jgi:hypothetical protein